MTTLNFSPRQCVQVECSHFFQMPAFLKWIRKGIMDGNIAAWHTGPPLTAKNISDVFMTLETIGHGERGDGSNSDMPEGVFEAICKCVPPWFDGVVWLVNEEV